VLHPAVQFLFLSVHFQSAPPLEVQQLMLSQVVAEAFIGLASLKMDVPSPATISSTYNTVALFFIEFSPLA
jgi:hypothetical protein